MKSLQVLKTDIEKVWLKKVESLPIKYFSEQTHAFIVVTDDNFDESLLEVKCKNIIGR